jgi:hypothetical protein
VTTSPEPPIRIKTEDESSHWTSESSARGGGGIVGECDRCVKLIVLIGKRVIAVCLSVMLRNVVARNQFTYFTVAGPSKRVPGPSKRVLQSTELKHSLPVEQLS